MALALKKGIDRSSIDVAYQTQTGETFQLRMNGTATHGTRKLKVLGKPSRKAYVLQDEAGRLVEVTHQDATHATANDVTLRRDQFIEGDRLLTISGSRIVHERFRDQDISTPDAGYVAPDGTHIMRRTDLAQGGSPRDVEFVRDQGGAWLAKLTWTTNVKNEALPQPTVSLLDAKGVEYKATSPLATVFVAHSGDVLQLAKRKVSRPPPKQALTPREMMLPDGTYGVIKGSLADQASPRQLVVDHVGVPLGVATMVRGEPTSSEFGPDDFSAGSPLTSEVDLIETTAPHLLPDRKVVEITTAALRLGSGTVVRGKLVHKSADALVLTDHATGKSTLAVRRDGKWHQGQSKDRFIDADGTAWHATQVGASDGDVDYIIGRTIVDAHTFAKAKMFARTFKDGTWSFEPAPERSGSSLNGTGDVAIVNGTSYRIVSVPASGQSQADMLIGMFELIGKRKSAETSAHPIAQALAELGVKTPKQWKQRRAAIVADVRANAAAVIAKMPRALRLELASMTVPGAEDFPFVIGVKSAYINTPQTIADWNKIAKQELNDYHPADLAFFTRGPGGELVPASIGALRDFFDKTLGHYRPLVHFKDLARPTDVQVIDEASQLVGDPVLTAKARVQISKVQRGADDKLIVAYDACGNVAVRRLDMEHATDEHPAIAQWQQWLKKLPLLTTLQSDYFSHTIKKNNGAFGKQKIGKVNGTENGTKMGFMPGGYTESSGLRRLVHESLGHGTERMLPLMQTMIALTAYLDAAEGTNFMERTYQKGPWEQHTTNLEAYAEDSARYFMEHPYHAQLLMTVLQADSPAPKAMSDGGLYQRLRGAMGLDQAAATTGEP
ncbi:MAG: hypothetical protein IPL79_00250 [Myxococcales bacterium]|nr:hypothetical protein [Myxococcales bacterium]